MKTTSAELAVLSLVASRVKSMFAGAQQSYFEPEMDSEIPFLGSRKQIDQVIETADTVARNIDKLV